MEKTSQDRIGRALRHMYGNVSEEVLPERFRPVLRRLELSLSEAERAQGRRAQGVVRGGS